MSAIAEFILLPKTALAEIVEAASAPDYHEFLSSEGQTAVEFNWSGWVFNPLLPFLSKTIGMKGNQFEYARVSAELSQATGALHEIYSAKEKGEYLAKLDPASFSAQTLADYYNKFNACQEAHAGEWMLAGIRALRDGFARIDDLNVLLLKVG